MMLISIFDRPSNHIFQQSLLLAKKRGQLFVVGKKMRAVICLYVTQNENDIINATQPDLKTTALMLRYAGHHKPLVKKAIMFLRIHRYPQINNFCLQKVGLKCTMLQIIMVCVCVQYLNF